MNNGSSVDGRSGRLRVAALQMVSGPDVAANLGMAERLIAKAADAGAELCVLPEYFCMMGERATDKVDIKEAVGGPIQSFLRQSAMSHRIAIVGGSVPMVSPRPAHVLNCCPVYSADGTPLARYDKIHLFGFQRGEEHFDEAETITPGTTPVVCDVPTSSGPWRLGLSICYDLRFPELYRRLSPCDIITAPSAFTYTTGEAHWELLIRTRAVENQCFVVAAAQGGTHTSGRRTWGHSMIVDPWGKVLALRAEEGAGVIVADLDRGAMNTVRQQLPALRHRVL